MLLLYVVCKKFDDPRIENVFKVIPNPSPYSSIVVLFIFSKYGQNWWVIYQGLQKKNCSIGEIWVYSQNEENGTITKEKLNL